MSQRNPMNERYQSDTPLGKTRKSAASAKPKTKAASSVTIKSANKTPEQKKKEAKAARKKAEAEQRELDRKYYNPKTPEYKKLRRIWWILMACVVASTIVGFLMRQVSDVLSIVFVVLAYVFIILAFWLEFSKIRKIRRAYQLEMKAKEAADRQKAREERRREIRQGVEKPEKGKKGAKGKAKAQASKASTPEPEPQETVEETPKGLGRFFNRSKKETAEDKA